MIADNKPTYPYRRVEDKYLPDIQYLIKKVFKRKVSIDYLKNKYDTSFLGFKYVCTIAFDGENPIGFYGAFPQLFQIESKSFYVVQTCDGITLTEYQKQGIYYNLAMKAYEIMKENGVSFIYGFFNVNSYHASKKTGWKSHIRMKRFHIKTPTVPIAKIVRKIGIQNIYDKLVGGYLKQYKTENHLTTNFLGKRNGNIYDLNFFAYKNSFNHHHLIDLHNCKFWVKIDSILRVGFFKANTKSDFIKAINKLKKIAFVLGCTEILFQVTSNSRMYELLKEVSDPKESWRIGYFPFDDSIDINQIEFTYADLDNF